MADQRVDDREVHKIREAMRRDGAKKAAQRFDETSPEFRKAQQQRTALRSAGAQQRGLNAAHAKKESTMSTSTDDKQTPPAQQRSAQAQRTAAQQKVAAMKQRQAQQAARVRDQNAKSQSRGQGM